MKCSEFETMIAPYVEGKQMSAEDAEKFLEHLDHCPKCFDELETHYIVYQVSKQLDVTEEAESLEVSDFKKMLENQIKSTRNSIRRTNYRSIAAGTAILFAALILLGILIFLFGNN